MDSHQQKSRFLRNQGLRTGISRTARVAAAAGLAIGLFGPVSFSPVGPSATPASADNNLNWEGIRPPYAKNTGSAAPYASLTRFGQGVDMATGVVTASLAKHEIVVGANGDIFTAGKSGVAGASPIVYKSTDGGKSWNQSGAVSPAGTVVTGLVVSPKYPSDQTIIAAFTDGASGLANNGISVSKDGASSFAVQADMGGAAPFNMATAPNGAFAGAATANVRALAISPNFDNTSGAGTLLLAADNAAGGDVVFEFALTTGGAVNPTSPRTKAIGFTAGGNAQAVKALALATSPSYSSDNAFALLYTCGAGTGGTRCDTASTYVVQGVEAGAFNVPLAGSTRDMIGGTGPGTYHATSGGLGFPSDYTQGTAGGTYYTAVSNIGSADGVLSNTGDVYRHSGGGWSALQASNGAVGSGAPLSGIAVGGVSGSVNVLAVRMSTGAGLNNVYRSTNGGDTFSTSNVFLDGDKQLNNVQGGANSVAMDPNFSSNQLAYAAMPGVLGGVVKTTNKGSNWQDTALSNEAYSRIDVGGGISLSAAYPAGYLVMNDKPDATGDRSLWMTDNLSTTSNWIRIHRTLGPAGPTSGWIYFVPGDVKTSQTIYAFNQSVSSSTIIKTTDGGRTWDTTGSDPFSDTAHVVTMTGSSATRLIVGDDKGRIWNSTDGGSTWTQSTTTMGQRITSIRLLPDFGNKNTMAVSGIVGGSPEVFLSTDGGNTFQQIGSDQGTWGNTSLSYSGLTIRNSTAAGADYFVNKTLFARCNACSDKDVWRFVVGTDTTWTRIGVPTGIQPLGHNTWLGPVMYMMGSDGIQYRTWNALTVTTSTWSTQVFGSPPVTFGTPGVIPAVSGGTIDLISSSAGATFWYGTTGGPAVCGVAPCGPISAANPVTQLMGITWTTDYLAGPKLITPPDQTNVPTNVTQNGTPTNFTWSSVNRAQCYDFQLALDNQFNQLIVDPTTSSVGQDGIPPTPAGTVCGTAVAISGVATNPSLTVLGNGGATTTTSLNAALVQGNTYFWRVRVRAVGLDNNHNAYAAGQWSNVQSFAVGSQGAPTSPQPQLPSDGATMPNLGPIVLSWNNPSGTVQYEVQVIPLNQDGPGIDLIIGDPALVGGASYTIQPPVLGQGNYIMLPGATYNWRIRTTNKSGSISNTDPSWGPWSDIRSFKTPRPNAGTITLSSVTPSSTPTLSWKDSNVNDFYYEVQLSQDKTFNVDPATATAAVYWNLQHGGVSDPVNSWKTPTGLTLNKGMTYYWRVRQRVQATPNGPDEVGIAWSPTASFMVP